MSAAQKVVYSVFLSVIVFAGITILAYTGIFDVAILNLPRATYIFVFAAFFLTLFLMIFFCFNLRPYHWAGNAAGEMEASAETLDIISGEKKPAILNYSPEIIAELEEIETDEIIHYMEDEAVSPFLSILPLLNDDNKINDEVFDLEDISNGFSGGVSLFNRPFAFSQDNPKMLQGISYNIRNEVLYEENGIHYISNSVFDNDSGMEKELNNGFAKLVESVVNKI